MTPDQFGGSDAAPKVAYCLQSAIRAYTQTVSGCCVSLDRDPKATEDFPPHRISTTRPVAMRTANPLRARTTMVRCIANGSQPCSHAACGVHFATAKMEDGAMSSGCQIA